VEVVGHKEEEEEGEEEGEGEEGVLRG